MAKKDTYAELQQEMKVKTTFGTETDFNGTLRFADSLKIEGKFTGEIISRGYLIIGKNAEVRANIKIGSMVLGGTVHGNIEATEKLDLLTTGKLYGNIRAPKLKIADGVVFEGNCEMIKPAQAAGVAVTPPPDATAEK